VLSVVIPCCNEEKSVARFETELFPALDARQQPYELLAVDDGSSDGTRAALEKLAAAGRPLKVLVHERNRGLGAALRTGFTAAQGDWIVTLDADLTFHPSRVADLVKRQQETGADLVAGSPFSSASSVSWRRRLPSLLLNAFYRGLFSHGFTAYTPIFRLYRRAALSQLDLRAEGFEINAEIAARFLRKGLKVAETPVPLTTRTEGTSKLSSWRELARHARLIARLLASA
jgi:dolichol-phosphate mannosyltransferase